MTKRRPPRVAVVTHAEDRFAERDYALRLQAEHWARDGIDVRVVAGTREPVEADVGILHVDLTVVPPAYVDLVRRCPVALNARTADVSKRRISRQLVRPGDGWRGPVIVKTDRNCGGRRELRLLRRRGPLGRAARAVLERLPYVVTGVLRSEHYPVFPSPAAVPAPVWRHPRLVVERLLVERRDGHYVGRSWMFFGDVDTVRLLHSTSPIVKVANVFHREFVDGVPGELRARREELGFDYGKFDFAIVDGEAVLYDVSRTPTFSRTSPSWDVTERNRSLAAAIRPFLPW